MRGAALRSVTRAVGERLGGSRPGPGRALIAAAVTGTATAVATYKVLRSGGG